ncbi:MAG TPA: ABC transporter substrate-binding protein [Chloroflexota bacterium]|nr:ABC transporter substrate-binding protein [Chloroflexota bacterium]
MRRLFALLGLLAGLAMACGPAPATAPLPPPPAAVTNGAGPPAAAPASALAVSTPALAPLSPPAKVRIAIQGGGTDGLFFIAAERGYFERQGLEPELESFASSSDMIPALATGQMDVGGLGFNPALFNALARGVGIRIVAGKGAATPGHGSSALVVRQDLYDSGEVRDLAGLRGRTIANTPPPNATGLAVALSRGLASVGLADADVTIQPLPFTDMPAALAGGAVDAAFMPEPLVTQVVRNGIAVRLYGSDELYPNQETNPLGYGESFSRDRAEAARRFMVAYLQASRDWVNAFDHGIDRSAVIAILTKHMSLKDPAIWEAIVPAGINPDGYSLYQSGIDDQDWYLAKGTLQQRVDLAAVVDHSFVDYALGVLGRYTPPTGGPP